jgi:CTP-dependent riboflavin kinase
MAIDFKKALDPNNDLKHKKVDGGKDIECTYKGSKVSYNDYLDIHEERGENIQKGKKPNSIGMFSGFGEGTLKKPYEK